MASGYHSWGAAWYIAYAMPGSCEGHIWTLTRQTRERNWPTTSTRDLLVLCSATSSNCTRFCCAGWDILQETFFQAYIASKVSLNAARRRFKGPMVSLETLEDTSWLEREKESAQPERVLEVLEQRQEPETLIQQLPAHYAETVTLFYFEHLSSQESLCAQLPARHHQVVSSPWHSIFTQSTARAHTRKGARAEPPCKTIPIIAAPRTLFRPRRLFWHSCSEGSRGPGRSLRTARFLRRPSRARTGRGVLPRSSNSHMLTETRPCPGWNAPSLAPTR